MAEIDEIERLRGVIASDDERLKQAALRVWGEHIWGCDTPEMLAEKIEFLRARVAELERDAERYRWVKRALLADGCDEHTCSILSRPAEEWDAAIDAAMRKGKE